MSKIKFEVTKCWGQFFYAYYCSKTFFGEGSNAFLKSQFIANLGSLKPIATCSTPPPLPLGWIYSFQFLSASNLVMGRTKINRIMKKKRKRKNETFATTTKLRIIYFGLLQNTVLGTNALRIKLKDKFFKQTKQILKKNFIFVKIFIQNYYPSQRRKPFIGNLTN